MSKVICEVCGTTFPETANQCPICGTAKNAAAQTAADNGGTQAETGSTHAHVSGGRFSKSNVRKRNKSSQPAQRRSSETAKKEENKNGSNKALVIVVVVLLLAIIAVCAYIGIKFFVPESKPTEPNIQQTTTQPTQTQTQKPTQTQTKPNSFACTDIQLSSTIMEFTDTERSQLLSAVLTPANTTDELIFISLDPEVATVTDGGLVTPVGPGETIITVTCGEIQKECRIVCSFGAETEPTETQPTEPDSDAFELIFNTKYITAEGMGDVTLKVGETWRMYATMNVEASKVIWYSDNEAYATIKDGVITAVAPTKAYVLVHAEYGEVKYSCRIRVTGAAASDPEQTTPPATEAPAPTQPVTGVVLTMNRTDFTLGKVGDTWNVYKNTEISKSVAASDIVWTSEKPEVVTVVDGVVTAVGSGWTYIHAEYNGQTATCKVIVK